MQTRWKDLPREERLELSVRLVLAIDDLDPSKRAPIPEGRILDQGARRQLEDSLQ